MKTIISFASLLALGLIVGGVLTLAVQGLSPETTSNGAVHAPALDFRSMLIGLFLGLLLSTLSQVAWAELPRRVVNWVLRQEHNLFYIAVAAIFIAVLIFY